jgi:CHAD domain-containing protein
MAATVAAALAWEAGQALERAAQHLAQPGEARHDGVHQARKAIRRARAILALGGPGFSAVPAVRRLDAELRRLCRGLSSLRDADALQDALLHLASEAVLGPIECDRLSQPVQARRAARLAAALARDPDFARRRERLDAGRARLLTLPWSEVNETALHEAHGRALARLARALRRARRSEHPEDWHRLRRRLRRLRQQENVLERIAPGLGLKTPGIDELAERLGLAQDHALLLTRCRRGGLFPARDRALLRRLVEPLYAAARLHAIEALAAARRG